MTLALHAGLAVAPADAGEGRRFDGVEITVGVMNAKAIGNPAKDHARTWEARTGGRVRIREFPFADLYDALNRGLTGQDESFDVVFYASAWAGDFHPYLAELPPVVAEDESFDDIHPTYRDRLMKWDGHWISVTVDGDLFTGYYRRDLFDDPRNRGEFKARYGYELIPPGTWRQYRDIAEFFAGRIGPDGERLYGAAEAFAPGGQQFWDAFARAAAYTNPPGQPGGQFFDPETMRPRINNPGWARAVGEYLEILRFCPPQALSQGIADSRRTFVEGRAAMTLDWGDTGQISADRALSRVADNVGYFMLPGTTEVWNDRAARWETQDKPYKVPFLAFGGWVAGVPRASAQADAAWDFILWFSNPENSLRDVVQGDTGVNPYRFTHFSAIDAWTQVFSRRAAAEYLGVIKASLDSPSAALDLRLPGFNEYAAAFEIHLTRALRGEVAVQEALDAVAIAWDAITDRHGRESQRKLYRASMGLAVAR